MSSVSTRSLASLFEQTLDAFERSVQGQRQQGQLWTAYFNLAGTIVEIECSNRVLAESYLKAIMHLKLDGSEGDAAFRIKLKAAEPNTVPRPPVDMLLTPREKPRSAFESDDGRFIAAVEGEETSLIIFDRAERTVIVWLPNATNIPGYQLATPLRTPCNWFLAELGLQLVHAACVVHGDDAILIAGLSGSGKTVASLRCMQSGFSIVGDDFVIIGPSADQTLTAYSLYNSARLHGGMTEYFQLSPCEAADDKMLYYLFPAFRRQISLQASVRAILIPDKENRDSSPKRLNSDTLKKNIIVPTIAYLPGCERSALKNLVSLLPRVPAYGFNLSTDLDEIPGRVSEVIALAAKTDQL